MTIVANESYEVFNEGKVVKLRIGTNVLPMTWDVALKAAPMIRVALRNALEYIGASRVLDAPTKEKGESKPSVRESAIQLGKPNIYAVGPDVIWEIGNSKLTLTPEPARNISAWLHASGLRVQQTYFPDMLYRPYAANLTDAVVEEAKKQTRRDSTATFG